MKAIILAGGFGTRLGGITALKPKPMVEIGGRPIIWHIMKIYSHFGINDFVIALGFQAQVIKDYFFNYEVKNNNFTIDLSNNKLEFHNKHSEHKWKITLVDTGYDALKGSRLKQVEPYLDSDTNLLTYGDGVADIDINDLIKFHNSHGKMVTVTGVYPPSRFGELIEAKGCLKSFSEKSQTSQGLINGGFWVFNNKLLDELSSDFRCDLEHGTLEGLAKKGEVMVYKHKGRWECMDHERDVVHLNKLWKENKAFWKVW